MDSSSVNVPWEQWWMQELSLLEGSLIPPPNQMHFMPTLHPQNECHSSLFVIFHFSPSSKPFSNWALAIPDGGILWPGADGYKGNQPMILEYLSLESQKSIHLLPPTCTTWASFWSLWASVFSVKDENAYLTSGSYKTAHITWIYCAYFYNFLNGFPVVSFPTYLSCVCCHLRPDVTWVRLGGSLIGG